MRQKAVNASVSSLFSDPATLQGVGPKTREALLRLSCHSVRDILFHLPSGLLVRHYTTTPQFYGTGATVTVPVTVQSHTPPAGKKYFSPKAPYRVMCEYPGGFLSLVFFKSGDATEYYLKKLEPGKTCLVSGKLDRFDGKLQIVHPDYIVPLGEEKTIPSTEAIYPLTYGMTSRYLSKIIASALQKIPELPEWIEKETLEACGFKSFKESLHKAHHPESTEALSFTSPARARLAYDELLANQLALGLARFHRQKLPGASITSERKLEARLKDSLPFALTKGQDAVLEDIFRDQASPMQMMRLLQGDVGSGKTVVALCSMLNAVEAGKQAALMTPTDLLASQHFTWISEVSRPLGVKVALLTGRTSTKERKALLTELAKGEIDIVIGTHALFQEDVTFHQLGLIIIDEQHRFGVVQRLMLAEKGHHVDVLLMTATPIPRTLSLTQYGDMDISFLKDKPKGRQPIDTRTLPISRLEEVIFSLKRAISSGNRIYWICPLIAEAEEGEEGKHTELAAAEERYKALYAEFGERVGLMHGRMKTKERDEVMQQFASGQLDILVATTVIEVGIDVKEATIIIIEHAERFGLAQLHQLRGRVGRGSSPSSCLLLYSTPLSDTGQARLKIMRDTNDGFLIAEEDLRLRGAGEMLGVRQSGTPEFRFASLEEHQELLYQAAEDAKAILEKDPYLQGERGEALRLLLQLFGYRETVVYA